MQTYKELLDELQRVQAEVEAARLAGFQRAVEEIRLTVAAYKIAETDIFPPRVSRRRGSTRSMPRSIVAPKYRNPATGATWAGRGRRPHWLKDVDDIDAYLIERGPRE
ncbi:hypothetical protein WS90_25065 [Burkholderia cepacia]|uniref:DNA-binding protein H-NS-like C-terminal domain-containing protein n=1 Tax=Burkholderia cepacia TaxID=292 RepID=A0A103Z9H3_BURCE|nr:H-NS histone family protein [Burkholderia cepacia]KVK75923.1 hypothetical protein WS90_25065 [Burkholderia cepacia]